MLDSVLRSARRRALWNPGPATRPVAFDRTDIERLLPHRDPFLFVDAITALDLAQAGIRGERRIRSEDPVFVGHFPNQPVYPGVLLVETMGQLGICLSHFSTRQTFEVGTDARPVNVRALKIHHALFLEEVGPGDNLVLLARLLDANQYTAICAGQVFKPHVLGADRLCACAVMEVYCVD